VVVLLSSLKNYSMLLDFDSVIMFFLQYVPRPEDHVLGIVVDCKGEVSTLKTILKFLLEILFPWTL